MGVRGRSFNPLRPNAMPAPSRTRLGLVSCVKPISLAMGIALKLLHDMDNACVPHASQGTLATNVMRLSHVAAYRADKAALEAQKPLSISLGTTSPMRSRVSELALVSRIRVVATTLVALMLASYILVKARKICRMHERSIPQCAHTLQRQPQPAPQSPQAPAAPPSLP